MPTAHLFCANLDSFVHISVFTYYETQPLSSPLEVSCFTLGCDHFLHYGFPLETSEITGWGYWAIKAIKDLTISLMSGLISKWRGANGL